MAVVSSGDIGIYGMAGLVYELLHQAGIRSYVFTPLILHGVAIGTFNAGSSAPDSFSEEDVALLAELAKQMTIAVAKRSLAPYVGR